MLVEYRGFDTLRNFGVELEVGDAADRSEIHSIVKKASSRPVIVTEWQQTYDNSYWHIKQDSTCASWGSDYGWEVVSPKSSGVSDLLAIERVAKALADGGIKPNKNCGLHVHGCAADFEPAQMSVLLAHWLKIEPLIFQMVPPPRSKSAYCRPLRQIAKIDDNRYYDPIELWHIFRPRDLTTHGNLDRRVALNLVNYAKGLLYKSFMRKTVELRLPEGTVNPYQVKNWIRWFVHFIEFCRHRPMPANLNATTSLEEAMGLMGLWHDEPNCFYIFSKGLFETRTWVLRRLFCWSLLENDARRLLEYIAC